jgi:hypothetical protein
VGNPVSRGRNTIGIGEQERFVFCCFYNTNVGTTLEFITGARVTTRREQKRREISQDP